MRFLLLFASLLFIESVFALQFNRCVDANGVAHYTNLPLSTLDANCKQRENYYSLRLQSDYQRLKQNMDNPRRPIVADKDEEDKGVVEQVKDVIDGMVDADQALEQLLENTRNARQNPASRFFRARTSAVETILDND